VGGFPLFGKYSGLGLPSFVQSFLLPPMADFSLPRSICAGLPATFQGRTNEDTTRVAVTWRWDFGDPASGSANTSTAGARVSHVYAQGGTYPVRLIVEFNGLADTMIKNLTVLPRPTPPAWADTVLCQGDVLVLDAGNPGAAFTWSTGFSSQRINAVRSGQYDVRVAFGDCNETYSIQAEFVPEPTLNLGPDTLLCATGSYQLDATPTNTAYAGYRYLWTTGDTTPTITVGQSGTYRVTVGLGSCTQSAQVRVRLRPGPRPDLGPDTAFCAIEGRPLLDAGPGLNYLWWPSGLTSRTLQVDTPGTYAVTVMDADGCLATDTVNLVDNCLRVFLPSAFSPNADGLNDAFTWAFTQVESPILRIYDRWGGLVFESQDISGSWDGTQRQSGQAVPSGVYVYLLEGLYLRPDNRREAFARSGSLTILR
jgi:gliding motility-associated-like protein